MPPISRLTPGTSVAVILKVDQPTGHRVYGVVSELLTKGDHPRGVKVRLRDGRVGRVQAVVEEARGLEGEGAAGGVGANLGRDGENGGGFGSRGGGGFKQVQDVREDGHLWDESEPKEYFADVQFTVKQKKGKRKGKGAAAAELQQSSDVGERAGKVEGEVKEKGVATCPVCGEFKGDERAVAHHVEGHFAEG